MGEVVKTSVVKVAIGVVVVISVITIIIVIIMQSSNEEIVSILEAGVDTTPIIKEEDLDILGKRYSILNEEFEREINEIATGKANRHNKMDEELSHYGVYGKENVDPFKNEDYVNGIRITYEKVDGSIRDGASNFNDIIAVMSVIYEQKMDTVQVKELEETLEKLFWMSHTYTYYSDELYSCRHGCIAENNYKCTAVYKDYRDTRYLKYELYKVPYHEEYEELGYDEKENFRVVIPIHKCIVHGESGGGCILDESKVCYHGNTMENITNLDLSVVIDSESGENIVYSELGEEEVPDIDSKFLVSEPTKGQKVQRTDTTCKYYRVVKSCNTRKMLGMQIKTAKINLKNKEIAEENHSNTCSYTGDGECSICKSTSEAVDKAKEELEVLETMLNEHISLICEADENAAKYWCDGYKLCLGHKDHYKCPGRHKVVLCSGHTNINITIKVKYNKELLDEAFKVFN